MDAQVSAAVTAVDLSDSALRRTWFQLLCDVYREQLASGVPSWDKLAQEIEQRAGTVGIRTDVPRSFVEYVSRNCSSPVSVVADIAEEGDRLPALYEQLAGGPERSTEGYDEAAWSSFLAENGPRWNGDDASWVQFGQWFQYQADQCGLGQPAEAFLRYVASQSDKRAVFRQYGIAVSGGPAVRSQQTDVSAYPELAEGASGEWVDYLDMMLRRSGF